ncbi:hypothetical protein [Bradyrhizobium japonicum]|uniref:hypothetical protein n=1 Tax=Bradyrhizobium japonicum TaxID=375 RepID=UPI001BACCD6D|nr:hypothetical protein [Bradyrhizobium japonicum]MBR0962214.1 hypothetical protein [Bradyrhizobium japonicum]
MSGTSAGWTPERRAAQAARMTTLNNVVMTKARRSAGWSEARRAAKSAELKARNLDPAFQAKRRVGVANGLNDVAAGHVHPLVRGLFLEMKRQRASCERIAAPVGICRSTLINWRRHHMPQLDALDAALNVLGFELAIVPIGRRGPNGFATKKSSTGE